MKKICGLLMGLILISAVGCGDGGSTGPTGSNQEEVKNIVGTDAMQAFFNGPQTKLAGSIGNNVITKNITQVGADGVGRPVACVASVMEIAGGEGILRCSDGTNVVQVILKINPAAAGNLAEASMAGSVLFAGLLESVSQGNLVVKNGFIAAIWTGKDGKEFPEVIAVGAAGLKK